VDDATRAHADVENLMRSADIATIFLDRELNVKSYTPRAAEIYNVIPTDVGRPLSHLTNRLSDADFSAEAAKVLKTLHGFEREVRSADEGRYIVRFSPYRSADDHIDGVVLSFVDVTKLRRAESALVESNADRVTQTERMDVLDKAAAGHHDEMQKLKKEVNELSESTGEKKPRYKITDRPPKS